MNIFINKEKLLKQINIILFILISVFIAFIFFTIEFDFFQTISILKFIIFVGFIFFMFKWMQIILLSYKIAIQEYPFLIINERGITFIRVNKKFFFSWDQIKDIKLNIIGKGITLYLNLNAEIDNKFPFGKIGTHAIAAIPSAVLAIKRKQLYDLLLEYKPEFTVIAQNVEHLENRSRISIYNFLKHPLVLSVIIGTFATSIHYVLLAYKLVPFYASTSMLIILLSTIIGSIYDKYVYCDN